jgi:hypothetical protein
MTVCSDVLCIGYEAKRVASTLSIRNEGAIARSIPVIIWDLLASPAARYQDLGASYHTSRIDAGKKVRNHTRRLEALG